MYLPSKKHKEIIKKHPPVAQMMPDVLFGPRFIVAGLSVTYFVHYGLFLLAGEGHRDVWHVRVLHLSFIYLLFTYWQPELHLSQRCQRCVNVYRSS